MDEEEHEALPESQLRRLNREKQWLYAYALLKM